MTESVVLLDESGAAIGTAPKADVHGPDTPLHLAFSCYLTNAAGEVLLTRRAYTKKTWPGVLTNSCCGHPLPGEPMVDAVRRRLLDELGAKVSDIDLVLPRYRYRAVMADGTMENEMCPVYRAVAIGDITPDPAEVAEASWMPWPEFVRLAADPGANVSPWCRDQVTRLTPLGASVAGWPIADQNQLLPAARG